MKRKNLLKLASAIVLAAVITIAFLPGCAKEAPAPAPTPVPEAKVYEWKGLYTDIRGSRAFVDFEEFAADLEEMSGGRIKMTCLGGGEIASKETMISALGTRTMEFGCEGINGMEGMIPGSNIVESLPFGLATFEESAYAFSEGGLDKWMMAKGLPLNVYWLGHKMEGGFYLYTKEPIQRLKELKGMKIRAFGVMADLLRAAGASIVDIPWGECYAAAASGVFDGMVTMRPYFVDAKLYEVLKNVVLPGITHASPAGTFVNLDAWNELPDDLKAIVKVAHETWSYRSGRRTLVRGIESLAVCKEHGSTVITLPEEDIAELRKIAATEVWAKLGAQSTGAAEVLKIRLDYMKKLGYSF